MAAASQIPIQQQPARQHPVQPILCADKAILKGGRDIIGKNVYRLELPSRLKIHPVFHVLLLEPANKTQGDVGKPLPPLEVEGKKEYYVKNVLNSKYRWAKHYYLVKWREYSKEESSCQSGKDLKNTQKQQSNC